MYSLSYGSFRRRGFLTALLAIALFSSFVVPAIGWQPAPISSSGAASAAKQSTATLTAAEKSAVGRVKLETIREVTTRLSSKEFEGRGTGQPGADKAANYLAEEFAKLGLKPGGDNGTYLQAVKFRSAMVMGESSVTVGDVVLKHGEDYVVVPPYTTDQLNATGNVVFAGYGVVSTDLKRDDFAGLDLKGKVVILLAGQPRGVDPGAWRRASNPQATAMNIYGRARWQ